MSTFLPAAQKVLPINSNQGFGANAVKANHYIEVLQSLDLDRIIDKLQ